MISWKNKIQQNKDPKMRIKYSRPLILGIICIFYFKVTEL